MPNPEDPNEAECRWCYDTGVLPRTYRLCPHCTGMTGDLPQKVEPDRTHGDPEHWDQQVQHVYDDEPCVLSALDHGDPVCVHGYQTKLVWVQVPPDPTEPG